MKKICGFIGAIILICCLGACAANTEAQWQEQYDLGIRYLSDGNYEEAIIAFTAAIEIDPKRAEAYVGRGDAYIGSGETEDNLAAALSDYEVALDLDDANVDAWLGLADVYIRQGNSNMALEVLSEALDKTGNNQSIKDMIAQIESKLVENIERQLQEMLQQEGAVTYGDLPVFFGLNYNEVGNLLGIEQERTGERELTGYYGWNNEAIEYDIYVQECVFEGGGSGIYQVQALAPMGSSNLLEMEVHTTFELAETGAVGWRDIYLGDSFATVLQKLGLHDIPEEYKSVNIYLYAGEAASGGDIQELSGVTYGGIPTPIIQVLFFNEGETAPAKNIVFEFHDGTGDFLDRVIYQDIGLLHNLIA